MNRNQADARRSIKAKFPFACCAICGLQIATCLQVAHLDHNAANNEADNLAYLCPTHHWMYDATLYPRDAIKLLRAHWQERKEKPDHSARMKDAGPKAAQKRRENAAAERRSAAAHKAVVTRRANEIALAAKPEPQS